MRKGTNERIQRKGRKKTGLSRRAVKVIYVAVIATVVIVELIEIIRNRKD